MAGNLQDLRKEALEEVTRHILPFWLGPAMDETNGGFIGQILQDGTRVPDADKGGILNARILWTFSAAFRSLAKPEYRKTADRAFAFLTGPLWDETSGGIYWTVTSDGRPSETRKHVYVQAFAIYALAEYFRATGSQEALYRAISLFELIEHHAHDDEYGGYFEAYSKTWMPLDDLRLSDKDLNVQKSMNTHLHVLEAYTNLYRVWPDPALETRLQETLDVFLTHILDPTTFHMVLFFDKDWKRRSGTTSYGHDIEASWLLMEAADVLGDTFQRDRVRDLSVAMARAVHEEAQDMDGGIVYELFENDDLDGDKHWWPQAEAVVGFMNAYRESGDESFLDAALSAWNFIQHHMVDRTNGEWFWYTDRHGVVKPGQDKVGIWKCPYHNSRTCFELVQRIEQRVRKKQIL